MESGNNYNNNGRGIFYGVIGVATLVVAIIGATFAYFTASVTKNDAITGVNSTTVTLSLDDTTSPNGKNFKNDLIPVDALENKALFKAYPGLLTTGTKGACKDDTGTSICSVYTFTILNDSETAAQTVVGNMRVITNSFDNLHYALFKGDDASIRAAGGYDLSKSPIATASTTNGWATKTPAAVASLIHTGNIKDDADDNGIIAWPNTVEGLGQKTAEGTAHKTTYTVVIWLEDTGIEQNEQGKAFAAGITFKSAIDDTNKGITGVLSAAGA